MPAATQGAQELNWRDAAAGAAAGVCNVLALHPLDVVKTRLQGAPLPLRSSRALAQLTAPHARAVQDRRPAADVYRGTVHAFKTIVRTEARRAAASSRLRVPLTRSDAQQGWLGLYAGLSPALAGGTLAWGLYFACYNRAKARYARWRGVAATELPATAHLAAAAEAGATVAVLTNPIWVAKTRLQLQRRPTGAQADGARYSGLLHALRRIAADEGLRGLYRGLGPSLALVSHGALQFTAYEALKKRALAAEAGEVHDSEARLSAAAASAIGVASKLLASGATYPSQVLRARLQQRRESGAAAAGASAEGGAWSMLRGLLQREGLRGLYKGWVPNVLRVLPSSALTFLVYEKVSQALEAPSDHATKRTRQPRDD
jgi:solute carrier family 25 folate transporter 32